MYYLLESDYNQAIQQDHLNQIIDSDTAIRQEAELMALSEMQSYLRHRYDVAKIFSPITAYDITLAYTEGKRVQYNDGSGLKLYYTKIDTPAGTLPTDTTYWTQGDNRDPWIKSLLVDMTLYHLHSRINPRNTPELRAIRYDGNNALQTGGAIGWLKKVANGDLSSGLETIEDIDGEEYGRGLMWFSNDQFIGFNNL